MIQLIICYSDSTTIDSLHETTTSQTFNVNIYEEGFLDIPFAWLTRGKSEQCHSINITFCLSGRAFNFPNATVKRVPSIPPSVGDRGKKYCCSL